MIGFQSMTRKSQPTRIHDSEIPAHPPAGGPGDSARGLEPGLATGTAAVQLGLGAASVFKFGLAESRAPACPAVRATVTLKPLNSASESEHLGTELAGTPSSW